MANVSESRTTCRIIPRGGDRVVLERHAKLANWCRKVKSAGVEGGEDGPSLWDSVVSFVADQL